MRAISTTDAAWQSLAEMACASGEEFIVEPVSEEHVEFCVQLQQKYSRAVSLRGSRVIYLRDLRRK
jgi:hypothetical protein